MDSNSTPIYRFGDFELDGPQVELRQHGQPVRIEPQCFEMLRFLIENRDHVITKFELLDAIWGHRFVSESALSARIKKIRKAVGDNGKTQHTIRTAHGRGYQFVAELTTEAEAPVESHLTDSNIPDATAVSFVPVRGGLQLAVGETGTGMPLVKVANWLTHVGMDSDSPVWSHWVRDLSKQHRYIRYDARGSGLSDRDLAGIPLNDLDLWVEDLENVVQSLSLKQFALMGVSQGGPVATAYAARHPDQVSQLILFGTYARGMTRRGNAQQGAQASLQVDLAKVGWGSDNDQFLEVFTRQFIPGAGEVERGWFNALQRTCADGETAAQLESAMHNVDTSDVAASIEVPTLVMHCTQDAVVPFEEGRRLAGLIPGSRFVQLPGANHIMLERDVAWPTFMRLVNEFTGATRPEGKQA